MYGASGIFVTAAARRAGIAHALIASGDEKGVAALHKAAKCPRGVANVVASASRIHTDIANPDSREGRLAFQDELLEQCRPRYPDQIAGKLETLIAKLAPFLIAS